jgi:hypothetical protein
MSSTWSKTNEKSLIKNEQTNNDEHSNHSNSSNTTSSSNHHHQQQQQTTLKNFNLFSANNLQQEHGESARERSESF